MKPDLQRRVQRYGWDKAASQYEPCWRRQLRPAQDRLFDLAAPRPGERVLDVACGTGLVTFRAAAAVHPGGEVVGVDLSDGMLELARRLARDQGFDGVRFERMDAEALELEEGTFDVALCSLGLMYVPDPVQALREMHRTLVPGGRAAAAVWGRRDQCGWAEVFPIVDRRVSSDVCPLFFQLGSGEALAYAFRTAGFEEVTADRFSSVLHYETAGEACTATFEAGAVALAYQRFDDATRDEVHAEFLASLEPWRRGNAYDVPGEFVVACGRKPS